MCLACSRAKCRVGVCWLRLEDESALDSDWTFSSTNSQLGFGGVEVKADSAVGFCFLRFFPEKKANSAGVGVAMALKPTRLFVRVRVFHLLSRAFVISLT